MKRKKTCWSYRCCCPYLCSLWIQYQANRIFPMVVMLTNTRLERIKRLSVWDVSAVLLVWMFWIGQSMWSVWFAQKIPILKPMIWAMATLIQDVRTIKTCMTEWNRECGCVLLGIITLILIVVKKYPACIKMDGNRVRTMQKVFICWFLPDCFYSCV